VLRDIPPSTKVKFLLKMEPRRFMQAPKKPVFFMLLFTGIVVLLILLLQPAQIYWFQHQIALLFPKGLIALEERDLLFVMQFFMLLVIIPVYILTFIFSWRYRSDNKKATYDPDLVDHTVAEFIWWGVPLVIVIIIGTLTWIKTYELDPYRPIPSDKKDLQIEVVALQWKWLFIYPEEGIATVNYLQFPAERPLHFLITADAPMNSFWIPKLGSQIYAMPGMRTELYLIADEPGEFRGVSANISGEGFARMNFIAKASSDEDFQKWVEEVKKSSKKLDWTSYQPLAEPGVLKEPLSYQLGDPTLFHQVLMKFMMPPKAISEHEEKKGHETHDHKPIPNEST
jgi:cytochrome o ubiquinol oxidase subunit 2